MLSEAIKNLANQLEIEVPKPDSNGHYDLEFADGSGCKVHEKKSEDGIILSAPMPELNSEDHLKSLRTVLKWNFARMKESMSTITWDPEAKAMILYRDVPYDQISQDNILVPIEVFLNDLDFWNEAIKNPDAQTNKPL